MRVLWRAVGIVSAVCTVVLLFGFGYAVRTVMYPQGGNLESVADAPKPPDRQLERLNIVAIGDSLTAGTGDETGKGYVTGMKELLDERLDVPVYVLGNFAQNGYTTSQVLAEIESRKGIRESIGQADVIVMTAGGNDLFRLGDEVDLEAIRDRFPDALTNIREILVKIKEINNNAKVYYIGLYNPFIELPQFKEASLTVQDWNTEVFRLAERMEGVTFVPTFDLFENGVSRFLSSDDYHPNGEGYARIAQRLAMLLE
ncbi:GDSL-type esterase/lipase family protein [Paenibacillus alkalitolerans]|uniref:GDSL-type esterase/lipase family protein n=1 Tax=Paenibacillus alkalitolerans TaxID=2799335 RepID=UPI0018F4BF20|nr:GDSL-type esterase/lipase family protein [Paenibacillus alkalitolerans]